MLSPLPHLGKAINTGHLPVMALWARLLTCTAAKGLAVDRGGPRGEVYKSNTHKYGPNELQFCNQTQVAVIITQYFLGLLLGEHLSLGHPKVMDPPKSTNRPVKTLLEVENVRHDFHPGPPGSVSVALLRHKPVETIVPVNS